MKYEREQIFISMQRWSFSGKFSWTKWILYQTLKLIFLVEFFFHFFFLLPCFGNLKIIRNFYFLYFFLLFFRNYFSPNLLERRYLNSYSNIYILSFAVMSANCILPKTNVLQSLKHNSLKEIWFCNLQNKL